MNEIISEVLYKNILHWNCRGLVKLPEELKIGTNVTEIYLKWNNLLCLPVWIKELKNLTNLYLQHNQLESLPQELSELSQLNILDVTNNKLRFLPSGLSCLSHLTHLLAAENDLTCIPDDFQMLQSLKTLDLSKNKFAHLPEAITECLALQELYFDHNNVTSLPQNIVYLPNLDTLSLSSNNLLYLPFQPFLSNPLLRFENNKNLNYLSIWLGEQISSRNKKNWSGDETWNLMGAQGCFFTKQVPTNSYKGCIVVGETTLNEGIILIQPPSLKHISSGTNSPAVPPLMELSLRIVYRLSYHHVVKITDSSDRFVVVRTETALGTRHLKSLPLNLQRQLKVGPAVACYHCQQPVFIFGIIWIILKESYFSSSDLQKFYVLSAVVFCSVSCSMSYAELERSSCAQYKLQSRKLDWFTVK